MNKLVMMGSSVALALVLSAMLGTSVHADTQTTNCDYTVGNGILTANVNLGDMKTGSADITNHSDACTYNVGVAVYKVYSDQGFAQYKALFDGNHQLTGDTFVDAPANNVSLDWLTTQELYSYKLHKIEPGQTWHVEVGFPSCAFQIDAFEGNLIHDFAAAHEDYDAAGLSRWIIPTVTPNGADSYEMSSGLCTKPTATPTVTPTAEPTVTPTVQPTAAPSQVLGVSTTPVATQTPTELPNTGPGSAVLITLGSLIAALVGKKYFLFN